MARRPTWRFFCDSRDIAPKACVKGLPSSFKRTDSFFIPFHFSLGDTFKQPRHPITGTRFPSGTAGSDCLSSVALRKEGLPMDKSTG